MKKKFLAALLGAMMMTGAVCSATIPASQLEIGGIKCGATISDVERICGQPLRVEKKNKPGVEKVKYEYRDFEVEFINGRVQEIEVDEESNLKTAAGIGVGSTLAELERAYGKADLIHKDKYIYYVNGEDLKLAFKIKNGRVHEFELDEI